MSKETFLKYGFVVLFIGIFYFVPKNLFLSPFRTFFGYSFACCCVFNTREKMNFFSSLLTVTDQPSSTQQRLGQLSGLVSLLIGLLLVIFQSFYRHFFTIVLIKQDVLVWPLTLSYTINNK